MRGMIFSQNYGETFLGFAAASGSNKLARKNSEMPATVRPSANPPRPIRKYEYKHEPDRRYRFSDMCPKEDTKVRAIINSSFDSDTNPSRISSPNGLVLGALKAYNNHHHLLLRPDDIFLAILTQLSFLH